MLPQSEEEQMCAEFRDSNASRPSHATIIAPSVRASSVQEDETGASFELADAPDFQRLQHTLGEARARELDSFVARRVDRGGHKNRKELSLFRRGKGRASSSAPQGADGRKDGRGQQGPAAAATPATAATTAAQRRSDAARDLDLATCYLRDARAGRKVVQGMSRLQLAAYRVHFHPVFFMVLATLNVVHLFVSVAEPASSRDPRGRRAWTIAVDAVCSFMYVVDVLLTLLQTGPRKFAKSAWSRLLFLVSLLTCADVIMAMAAPAAPGHSGLYLRVATVQFARPLRPFVLVVRYRRFRSVATALYRTVPKLLPLFALVTTLLLVYGLVAVQIFGGSYPRKELYLDRGNFDDLLMSTLTLYVLITSENFPVVMTTYGGFSYDMRVPFFASFYLLSYLLMAVVISVIFETYREIKSSAVIVDRIKERRSLAAAFYALGIGAENEGADDYDNDGTSRLNGNIATDNGGGGGDGGDGGGSVADTVPAARVAQLLNRLNPDHSPADIELLHATLSPESPKRVPILGFFSLCDVLVLRFRRSDRQSLIGRAWTAVWGWAVANLPFCRCFTFWSISARHRKSLKRIYTHKIYHRLRPLVAVTAVLLVVPLTAVALSGHRSTAVASATGTSAGSGAADNGASVANGSARSAAGNGNGAVLLLQAATATTATRVTDSLGPVFTVPVRTSSEHGGSGGGGRSDGDVGDGDDPAASAAGVRSRRRHYHDIDVDDNDKTDADPAARSHARFPARVLANDSDISDNESTSVDDSPNPADVEAWGLSTSAATALLLSNLAVGLVLVVELIGQRILRGARRFWGDGWLVFEVVTVGVMVTAHLVWWIGGMGEAGQRSVLGLGFCFLLFFYCCFMSLTQLYTTLFFFPPVPPPQRNHGDACASAGPAPCVVLFDTARHCRVPGRDHAQRGV
jgi:hypothetical protein